MAEFLQSYGIWIIVGVLFLWMLRGHRQGGMRCGMSHDPQEHKHEQKENEGSEEKGHTGGCH